MEFEKESPTRPSYFAGLLKGNVMLLKDIVRFLVFLFFMPFLTISAQNDLYKGGIIELPEHYGNTTPDCDHLEEFDGITTIYNRACAWLAMMRADSVLKTVHDSLRAEIILHKSEPLLNAFDQFHQSWKLYRDQHCKILFGDYGNHAGAVAYMDEVRRLTVFRIDDLRRMVGIYRED